ncbi:preprotein translocase subunit SecG [Mangrovicoccus algicola]|uniref:Protein-export membrane protein SecG n=1 Tax=Mangrovicoccus algicola TaxID=2771008 RepID=A0A8J6Z9E7_9RHOB|nr:preprotein translocase subunit SecG [Mangrovicoccus algicola]MBE3640464.1 preprotein translocase subunit SecG [Mangrovicoccus algicola]
MQNVILIVHLILALCLIGAVLLQRSEGGGLGIGGGGGGGVMSSRGAASALAKVTWGFAAAFIATSITLTIIAAQTSSGSSVLDRLQDAPLTAPAETGTDAQPALPGGDLLPPSTGSEPAAPPRAE